MKSIICKFATGIAIAILAPGFAPVFAQANPASDIRNQVLAFLDVFGAWDPSLLFVMGGAVVLAFLGFRLVLRRAAPLWDERFHISASVKVDRHLLVGAAMFGLGWGLGGYCPGPAISSLGFGNPEALWFVPAMLAGAGLQRWQARR